MSLIFFLLLGLLCNQVSAHSIHNLYTPPIWQQASGWPDRIVVSPGEDATTSFSVTWRTAPYVARTIIQLAEASADTRFDRRAKTFSADIEAFDLETMQTEGGVHYSTENSTLGKVHYHSYTFTNLKPDMLYAYRVQGERGKWSEWLHTRTAGSDDELTFVYMGDSQNGVRSHWSRVIRQAFISAPKADFFLHAGDFVSKGDSDLNWAEWFDAGGFIHRMIPTVPVRGNHENITLINSGPRKRARTPFWRAQFTLPEAPELGPTLQESNYKLHYGKIMTLFVVDSATKSFDEQAKWLDKALKEDNARWKVLSMHHPFFVPDEFARNKTDLKRKKAFARVVARHDVDLVLTGHIHTYLRGSVGQQPMEDHAARKIVQVPGESQQVKTVFAISASGAKNTDIDSKIEALKAIAPETVARHAGNTPMYQIISIKGDVLTYHAMTAVGERYDEFSMRKQGTTKTLINGPATYGEKRLFSNTGEYLDWYDLR